MQGGDEGLEGAWLRGRAGRRGACRRPCCRASRRRRCTTCYAVVVQTDVQNPDARAHARAPRPAPRRAARGTLMPLTFLGMSCVMPSPRLPQTESAEERGAPWRPAPRSDHARVRASARPRTPRGRGATHSRAPEAHAAASSARRAGSAERRSAPWRPRPRKTMRACARARPARPAGGAATHSSGSPFCFCVSRRESGGGRGVLKK